MNHRKTPRVTTSQPHPKDLNVNSHPLHTAVSTFTNTIIRRRNLPKHHQTRPGVHHPLDPHYQNSETLFSRLIAGYSYRNIQCATNRRRLTVNQKQGKKEKAKIEEE